MGQLRNLAPTASAALAALTLLAACTHDDQQAQTASSPSGREPASNTTTPATDLTILGQSQLIGPGRWGVTSMGDPDAPVAVFDVPEGFQGHESWVWTDNQGPGEFAQLASWTPTRVPRDPCSDRPSSPPLGPTVQDLATALTAQERTTTTKPIPVTMGGHDGLYVELTTPARFDYEACGPDGMKIWETAATEPRLLDEPVTDRYWILEVDGHRVVISAMTLPAATRETVQLATGVVRTITFVDPE